MVGTRWRTFCAVRHGGQSAMPGALRRPGRPAKRPAWRRPTILNQPWLAAQGRGSDMVTRRTDCPKASRIRAIATPMQVTIEGHDPINLEMSCSHGTEHEVSMCADALI